MEEVGSEPSCTDFASWWRPWVLKSQQAPEAPWVLKCAGMVGGLPCLPTGEATVGTCLTQGLEGAHTYDSASLGEQMCG